MEAEVVRMACTLFHGGPNSCGTVCSKNLGQTVCRQNLSYLLTSTFCLFFARLLQEELKVFWWPAKLTETLRTNVASNTLKCKSGFYELVCALWDWIQAFLPAVYSSIERGPAFHMFLLSLHCCFLHHFWSSLRLPHAASHQSVSTQPLTKQHITLGWSLFTFHWTRKRWKSTWR